MIEHVENPFIALREMVRVSNKFVELYCPHRLDDWLSQTFKRNVFHKGYFGCGWFKNAAQVLECESKVDVSATLGLPSNWFSLFHVPHEIHARLIKRRSSSLFIPEAEHQLLGQL